MLKYSMQAGSIYSITAWHHPMAKPNLCRTVQR